MSYSNYSMYGTVSKGQVVCSYKCFFTASISFCVGVTSQGNGTTNESEAPRPTTPGTN